MKLFPARRLILMYCVLSVIIYPWIRGVLMIEHDVGISKVAGYEVKKIDSDFFSED
jgi:hypothetical protein